ncbi:MAG: sodium-dependent transporter [Bacteroidales bacterium]|nr:sodium-dependent transporter [Bacteroidales bacterium]
MAKRDSFASGLGVLAAMAGSAVGLGNLWRFPYLVGTNGGAAFIIIYLAFVFLLALPIMYSEFIIGRRSQANVFSAYKVLAPGTKWCAVGLIYVLASLFIISFYCVVGGWTINYFWKAISFQFNVADTSVLGSMFNNTVTSSVEPLVFMLIFLGATALIVMAGIKDGIERYTKIMMPMLFIIVVVVAIRSMTLPGAGAGLEFLFKPDFSKVTGNTLLNALGQAFFSLSIGCGTIMTYGSYVNKKENIAGLSAETAITDTTFAIIAGLAIMPAVFAFGISPAEGPGLVFVTLPYIFAQLPFGAFLAILFFFMLFIAAITSSISQLEVIVSYLKEEFNMSRKLAIFLSLAVIVIFGVLCSLSQGTLADVKIFGLNFFDFFDQTSANIFLPLGGFFAVIFVGWKMKKPDVVDEFTSGGTRKLNKFFVNFSYYSIKYLAPIVVAVVLISGLI